MPEDIEKMVDDFIDEMPTTEWTPPDEVWHLIGLDAEEDPSEAELVVEALETARNEPWYERLNRELSK